MDDFITTSYAAARGARELGIDVYLPMGTTRALVVYAHGGGFTHGKRDDGFARALAPRLTAQGIAFASISYSKGGDPETRWSAAEIAEIEHAQARTNRVGLRINPQYCGPFFYAALEDFSAALKALRSWDGPVRLDGLTTVTMGASAGGIVAASLCYPPRKWEWLERPDGAFGISAAMVQPWRLSADGPPVTMLHAPHDGVIPPRNLYQLDAKARAKPAPVGVVFTDVNGHRAQLETFLKGRDPAGHAWFDLLPKTVEIAHARRTGQIAQPQSAPKRATGG